MKHQTLICVYGYVVDSGVPEGWVELKLEGVEFGDGEKETAHNIRLSESAVTLFLQGIISFLCFFVPFHKSVVAVNILVLVDGLCSVFVYAFLDKTCDYIHLLEKFIAFGIYSGGVQKFMSDEPAIFKERFTVSK